MARRLAVVRGQSAQDAGKDLVVEWRGHELYDPHPGGSR